MHLGNSLECYYCDLDIFHDCDDAKFGSPVTCQFSNSSEPHYGNACVIAHSGGGKLMLLREECKWIVFRFTEIIEFWLFYLSLLLLFLKNIYVDGQNGELWQRKCVDSETSPGAMGCTDIDKEGVKTHICKCNTDLCNEKFSDTTENTPSSATSTTTSKPGKCTFYHFWVKNLI